MDQAKDFELLGGNFFVLFCNSIGMYNQGEFVESLAYWNENNRSLK
jgi:hypothetical protein